MKNKLYLGDCLESMKLLESNTVDSIYLDPPFYTQRTQVMKNRDGIENKFSDNWININEYINYLNVRILECKRVLKDSGTIFVHCDKNASHYIRILLDEIFGFDYFINEIIWTYKKWVNSKNGLQNMHQNIFWYSKSKNYKFNIEYTDYSPTTNLDQILLERERDINNKSIYSNNIAKQKLGVPLGDVWEIPILNPKAKERVNYPTQKPVILLERLIKIATDKNDIVLDPFCGSGTTLVAASILDRNYIGMDISKEALDIAKSRLENPIKTNSNLLKKGINSYITKKDKIDTLKKIGARIVYRNNNVDGIINSSEYGIVAVKIVYDSDILEDAVSSIKEFSKSKGLKKSIIIINSKNNSRSLFNDVIVSEDDLSILNIKNITDINTIV